MTEAPADDTNDFDMSWESDMSGSAADADTPDTADTADTEVTPEPGAFGPDDYDIEKEEEHYLDIPKRALPKPTAEKKAKKAKKASKKKKGDKRKVKVKLIKVIYKSIEEWKEAVRYAEISEFDIKESHKGDMTAKGGLQKVEGRMARKIHIYRAEQVKKPQKRKQEEATDIADDSDTISFDDEALGEALQSTAAAIIDPSTTYAPESDSHSAIARTSGYSAPGSIQVATAKPEVDMYTHLEKMSEFLDPGNREKMMSLAGFSDKDFIEMTHGSVTSYYMKARALIRFGAIMGVRVDSLEMDPDGCRWEHGKRKITHPDGTIEEYAPHGLLEKACYKAKVSYPRTGSVQIDVGTFDLRLWQKGEMARSSYKMVVEDGQTWVIETNSGRTAEKQTKMLISKGQKVNQIAATNALARAISSIIAAVFGRTV